MWRLYSALPRWSDRGWAACGGEVGRLPDAVGVSGAPTSACGRIGRVDGRAADAGQRDPGPA